MSIKYTCSLGPHCHSSYLLKTNNLKKASYPFDWIFTNHNIINEILNNNFENFLDKNYYINLSGTQCGHKLYHDSMFWHHNPSQNMVHYNYYVRCVNRFKTMILSEQEKLFVYLVKDVNEINEQTFHNDMSLLNENLKLKTTNFKLLAIIIFPNKQKNNYTFNSIDNIDFLNIDTLSVSDGRQFINNIDNKYISIILKVKYKFDLLQIM
jgi:hypothetical protein